jgi:hypothetical protein
VPVLNAIPAPLKGFSSTASALPLEKCWPTNAAFQASLSAERQRNGFLLDYVIHMHKRIGGPHSIEVQLSYVSLYWPYLTDMKLVWDIIEVYSHFAFVHWAPPNPPPNPPLRWMFVNVLLSHGQLLIVSPHEVELGGSVQGAQMWQPALALRWDLLRVGYDWGGDSESVLLVNLCNLSACIVKRLNTSLITHRWDHQSGLYIEHKYLLKPVNGQIRWYAHKPPRTPMDETKARGHQPEKAKTLGHVNSMTGSVHSNISRNAASVALSRRTASGFASSMPDDDHEWATVHNHELSISLDAVKLQPVLSDRWHFQSLLDVVRQLRSPRDEQDDNPPASVLGATLGMDASESGVPAQGVLQMVNSESSQPKCCEAERVQSQYSADKTLPFLRSEPQDWESRVIAPSTPGASGLQKTGPSNANFSLGRPKAATSQARDGIALAREPFMESKHGGKGRRLLAPVAVDSFTAIVPTERLTGMLTSPIFRCALQQMQQL